MGDLFNEYIFTKRIILVINELSNDFDIFGKFSFFGFSLVLCFLLLDDSFVASLFLFYSLFSSSDFSFYLLSSCVSSKLVNILFISLISVVCYLVFSFLDNKFEKVKSLFVSSSSLFSIECSRARNIGIWFCLVRLVMINAIRVPQSFVHCFLHSKIVPYQSVIFLRNAVGLDSDWLSCNAIWCFWKSWNTIVKWLLIRWWFGRDVSWR